MTTVECMNHLLFQNDFKITIESNKNINALGK